MKREKKEHKSSVGQGAVILGMLLVGGILGGFFASAFLAEEKPLEQLFRLALFLILLYLVQTIQIIIHEAGHMIAGLCSGYQFLSFRIFSFMLVKQDGALHLKRYSLAGTAGQCLLAPPEWKDGTFPFLLYNLGGSIANFIAAGIFALLAFFCADSELLELFFTLLAAFGVLLGLTNGIPLRLGMVDNDGRNVCSMRKDKTAQRAFWLQLAVNAKQIEGVPLRDMPEEWFVMPADASLDNAIVSAVALLCCSRLIEEERFAEAEREITRLLNLPTAYFLGVYEGFLKNDLLFCELMGEKNALRIAQIYDKRQQKTMKQLAAMPAVLRTEYALARWKNQEKHARKIRAKFDRVCSKYPEPATVASERSLLDLIDKGSIDT